MNIKNIDISNFRHLNAIGFDFGKIITVIAGGNGTGKTSLLGIIGHIFKFGNTNRNLFGERFETKYSAVFRFSHVHDLTGNYSYKLFFENGTSKNGDLRTTSENGKIRHRIDVGGRIRGGGKIIKPVIFLSLKRLLPLAQENERYITLGIENLSQDLITEYNQIYNEVFSVAEAVVPVHTKSNNKNSFSPTTARFDAHGISAGQDNIGHIILAILSFSKLKNERADYEGGLLLIDELDATLYPAAQKNLLKVLLRKGKELNLQIIFTTHSSDLLNFLSSRDAANFKHSTNFVSLSNARGVVTVEEGFSALTKLLADLNHEALRTIQPKKINFYFEDSEASYFYRGIIEGNDFGVENSYKNLSISCGTYKSLIEKGFEEFFRSVVVLDGDFKATFQTNHDHNVVFLPGTERPENVIKYFLETLPESDQFWDNEYQYTKRVFLNNLFDVKNNRDSMKQWFNSEMRFWGDNGNNLFNRWKECNPEEANSVIDRTTEIIRRIMDNFYALSTSS